MFSLFWSPKCRARSENKLWKSICSCIIGKFTSLIACLSRLLRKVNIIIYKMWNPVIKCEIRTLNVNPAKNCKSCKKKTIFVYIILLVSGFIHQISIDAYEGKDVYKYTQFYLKEPITYVIFPLIGAYMIITISLIVLPVIYLCRAILIGR